MPIEHRFAECGLELHPEKTKIVDCKDDDTRGRHTHEKFDFLGYTFRARRSKNRWGTYYGRYYKSAIYPTLRYLDRRLARWAMAKYKRLRRHRRKAQQWVHKAALREAQVKVRPGAVLPGCHRPEHQTTGAIPE
jgi:hypothetical protein